MGEPIDEGEVSVLCATVVKTALMVFGVIGVFGNFHIILATYLHRSLRTKCGMLLSILAFCDLWSLIFEMLSGLRLWTNTAKMPRTSCFRWIVFYLFIENIGTYVILAIGFDRLFAISWPIRYAVVRKTYYVIGMVLPGVLYSLILVILGIVHLDDAIVPVCNPPLAYAGFVTHAWNVSGMVICFCNLAVYITTYIMLYKVAPKHLGSSAISTSQLEIQRTIVKTLTVNVVAFTSSGLLSALIICVMNVLKVNKNTLADVVTYAVIPGLLNYSINYYVYFWRSTEYRKAFLKQLTCSFVSEIGGRAGVFVRAPKEAVFTAKVKRISVTFTRQH